MCVFISDCVLNRTSFTVDLLWSPVEIHLAGVERRSLRLGRGGRSGVMLSALRQSKRLLVRVRAEVAAAAWAASLVAWTAQRTVGRAGGSLGPLNGNMGKPVPVADFKIKHICQQRLKRNNIYI